MRNLGYILLFLLISLKSFSQITLSAKTDKQLVQTGESFILQLTSNSVYDNYTPPNLSHFNVLGGPSVSQRESIVNGKRSFSITFTYKLSANNPGTFVIGEASISVKGKLYTSNPIEVEVVKSSANNSNNNSNNVAIDKNNENLFIKATTSKSKTVTGEQILITYKLYTRYNQLSIADFNPPDFGGFWKQEVNLPDQKQFIQENLNGVIYNTTVLKQFVIFPQKSGKLDIDPMNITFQIQVKEKSGRNGFFDQFFGKYTVQNVDIKSNSLNIDVSPLPAKNKPADFSGGVGNFSFNATTDKTELKSNEAFNLELTIKGSGNIQLLDAPKIDFPADFEVYDPKINDQISTTANGVSGKKTYQYLIIPRHSGDFTIPEITFSYFENQSKTYKTITKEPINITVQKSVNEDNNNTFYNTNNKENLKVIGKDIRYIHTKTSITETKKPFFNTIPYYLILCSPFILATLIIFSKNKLEHSNIDNVTNRKKKATRVASKKLETAKKHLLNNDKDKFYEEVTNAVYGYFEDKFNIDKATINKETITNHLQKIEFNNTQTNQLLEIIDKCEMARFAPVLDISPEGIYETVLTILTQIETSTK